jgi:hypothetical protein
MSGKVIHLNRTRWLELANLAMAAAAGETGAVKVLGEAAGRMVTATPPATEKYAMSLCTAFRWACQAFAFATAGERIRLAAPLRDMATALRWLFEHVPPPSEAQAVAAPVARPAAAPRADLPDHPWLHRRDLNG